MSVFVNIAADLVPSGCTRGLPALLLVVLALLPADASAEGRCGDPGSRPWCDTSLSADRRAELLLAQLTADEKIALLGGDELSGVAGGEGTHTGTSDGIERLGIPTIYFSDGPAGVRSGKATAMPSPIALGASFDPANSARDAARDRRRGDQEGQRHRLRARRSTSSARRSPAACSRRSAARTRTSPPQLAVPWIKAAQDKGLIANVKHYAGNNQEGTGPHADEARPATSPSRSASWPRPATG